MTLLKQNWFKLVLITVALGFFASPFQVSAHRSGCHRWHSCPSDSGSYVCGDLGYTSGCPIAKPLQITTPKPSPKKTPIVKTTPVPLYYFVGKPKTYADLYNCNVVGNYNSMIYHTKGSKYIKKMNLSNKECFASEVNATSEGFRKAKVR